MQILEFIEYVKESVTHIEHPEDLVFTQGSAGAIKALQALNSTIAQPKNITIKWDGFPALIFGRDVDGRLIVVDKHMFTKRDGSGRRIYSVQNFMQYDAARGVTRGDLYEKLAVLWPILEQAVPANSRGYYWGDLLWTGIPSVQNNEYVFKPNTVLYHVPVTSDLGKQISKSRGGIVVHQYFPDFDSPPQVLQNLGSLNLNVPLVLLMPGMTDSIRLKIPVQLVKQAEAAIKKYGSAVDALIDPINLAGLKITDLPGLMKMYINFQIRGGTQSFYDWLPQKLSAPKLKKLYGDNQDGYLFQHAAGVQGALIICAAIAALKNNIIWQIDKQQQTVKATINGSSGGEGYVISVPGQLIKLVNRSQFSAANFAKNT